MISFEESTVNFESVWETHKLPFCQDKLVNRKSSTVSETEEFNALIDLATHIKNLSPSFLLSNYSFFTGKGINDDMIHANIVTKEQALKRLQNSPLNDEQQHAATNIIAAISEWRNAPLPKPMPPLFSIDGPAGTGKTRLIKDIVKELITKGLEVFVTAATGLASTNYDEATTLHSFFKLSIDDLQPQSTLAMDKVNAKVKHVVDMDVLVIDEVFSLNCRLIEAVDKYLRVLMKLNVPFGTKVVIFGGDIRQTLPIVKSAEGNEMSFHLLNSQVWLESAVQHFTLTKNMRIQNQIDMVHTEAGKNLIRAYGKFILAVGEGRVNLEPTSETVEIPDVILSNKTSLDAFVTSMFPKDLIHDEEHVKNTTILAVTHNQCRAMNRIVFQTAGFDQSKARIFKSHDTEGSCFGPVVADTPLSSPGHNSIPDHVIQLAIGMPVMLMRNCPYVTSVETDGRTPVHMYLANGTRCIVVNFEKQILVLKVMDGPNADKIFCIPRFLFTATVTAVRGELKRRQFPVRVAYAITINKSQGSTLTNVGVCLDHQCFAHGQLYVALSRVGNPLNMQVYLGCTEDDKTTPNFVNKQIADRFKPASKAINDNEIRNLYAILNTSNPSPTHTAEQSQPMEIDVHEHEVEQPQSPETLTVPESNTAPAIPAPSRNNWQAQRRSNGRFVKAKNRR